MSNDELSVLNLMVITVNAVAVHGSKFVDKMPLCPEETRSYQSTCLQLFLEKLNRNTASSHDFYSIGEIFPKANISILGFKGLTVITSF